MNKLTLDRTKFRNKWVFELNYTSGIWKHELGGKVNYFTLKEMRIV